MCEGSDNGLITSLELIYKKLMHFVSLCQHGAEGFHRRGSKSANELKWVKKYVSILTGHMMLRQDEDFVIVRL